ncbi:ABC transporter permease [Paenibacillus methanolicus]|uniref:ABC-2 type transport system permease protein n=1 Tax=Paenibacillus methanolicus TaxID=582686 RepID=A0A5S5BXG6_9BACL|nr:ABC transporter permease [Paenibacillus methanolicus]TYP71865.1 ABC-2 type transport system permease protein [Paenibacillus methanolicus]
MTSSGNNSAARAWTIRRLFRKRVARFWKEQRQVWGTVVDWVVLCYLLFPALIGGVVYAGWWADPPAWMASAPLWAAQLPPMLLAVGARFRTFAEDADMLFLVQRGEWRRGLLLYGFAYTAAGLAVPGLLIYALLLPVLMGVHGMQLSHVALLLAAAWSVSLAGAVWRNRIHGRFRGWRKEACIGAVNVMLILALLLPSLLSAGAQAAAWLGCALAGVGAALLLLRGKLRQDGDFASDVRLEHLARLSGTALLVRDVVQRKPLIRLDKPLVFRRSQRLFRSGAPSVVLAESALKSFLRQWLMIRYWISFLSLGLFAVSQSPLFAQIALALGIPLLVNMMIQNHILNFAGEAFVRQFRWEDGNLRKAGERLRLWLVAPIALMLGAVAGYDAFGFLGLMAGTLLSAAYLWFVNNLTSAFGRLRATRSD